jgi:hypothetical protein
MNETKPSLLEYLIVILLVTVAVIARLFGKSTNLPRAQD